MKKSLIFITFLALLLLVAPVFGLEYLKKDDLKITIEGKKDCYIPGDELNVTITIAPKDRNIAEKMERREYTIKNNLKSPSTKVQIYISGLDYPITRAFFNEWTIPRAYLNLSDFMQLEKIVIIAKGYIPSDITSTTSIIKYTFLEFLPEVGDAVYFNVTVVNPSKLEETLNNLENELKKLKNEIDELGKFVNVESLKEDYDKISSNLTLAREYVNDKEYSKVSEKITWIEKALKDLKNKITEKKADYYYDKARNLLNDIDALMVEGESYLEVAKSAGKAQEVMQFEINMTKIKYDVSDLKSEFNDIKKLYEDNKFEDVIDKAKDFVEKAEKIKLQLGMIVNSLKDLIHGKTTLTPRPPTKLFNFKFDTKILTYLGIGIAVIVGGGIAAVAISKWRQKRKWDELR